jgi:dimethylamine monooxygenase subunit C
MTAPGPGGPGPAPLLVLAVGDAAGALAAGRCPDGDRRRVLGVADDAGAVLDAELPLLTTGWRVLAVGIGRDVRTVRAAALARGALDEEVTVWLLDSDTDTDMGADVRVYCGACHHRFDARAGEHRPCPGCGVDLAVTDHESRTHGAVLGAPRVP